VRGATATTDGALQHAKAEAGAAAEVEYGTTGSKVEPSDGPLAYAAQRPGDQVVEDGIAPILALDGRDIH
jgi:hypothetical protein